MTQTATVACLGGSLARPSRSLRAVEIAADAARETGADAQVLGVLELDLPFYRPGADPPQRARTFVDTIYAADGLIWSSPMYHGTVSGSFKNALDWLQLLAEREPPFLTGKIVGLISTAGGVQGLQAINTMEYVVRALRGWAVPLVIPISARQAFDEQSHLLDRQVEDQLRVLGREVAEVCLGRRSGAA